MRRNASAADEFVSGLIVARLSRDDAADLLRPPVRPGIDAKALRSEAKRLRARKAAQVRMHALGELDDADLAEGAKAIRARLAEIEAALAESDVPDPLAEFRDRPAAAVWESLPIARKRAVARLLVTVTFLPVVKRSGPRFDTSTVLVEPATGAE